MALAPMSNAVAYCGCGPSWQAAGAAPALPCCHVGTSHLEQAPSIRPMPSSNASRSADGPAKRVVLSTIAAMIGKFLVTIPRSTCPMIPRPAAGGELAAAARLPEYRGGISTILPLQARPLGPSARQRRAASLEGDDHGLLPLRLAAVAPRPARLVHRHRLAGPDHRGAGAGARAFRHGAVRARRAHPLAHPSARPDARRHFRMRPVPDLGRQGARDPSRRRDLDSA